MRKLSSFLVGLVLASLGSGASAAIAQLSPSHSLNASPAIAQTPTTTTPEIAPSCPLPTAIAVTFLNSECRKVVLTAPTTFYRYYSTDGNRYGRYLTTDRFERNVDVIRKLALNQAWGNQATMMLTVTVPAGTAVYQGIVAPQEPTSCYIGGGQQTFIENTRDPNLSWSAGTPMQVESFTCP